MPNCDFFAVGNDHRLILEFLFTSGDCDVHEHSSRFDQRVRVFRSLAEIEEHFAVTDWRRGAGESILLQLYPHGAGSRVEHERVALDLRYARHRSFLMDLRIIIKTVAVIIDPRDRGAY